MSTPGKKYVHARDQQRNFANRRPDLSFMICDEEALGLEEYLKNLKDYIESYKTKYLHKLKQVNPDLQPRMWLNMNNPRCNRG